MALRIHYGWWVAAAGFLVMAACLGLARFSFGALLPPMAQALELSYARQGWLGTGNFIGYLVMVGAAPWLSRRLGPSRAVVLGLGLIAATMAGVGASGEYGAALALYVLTGVGSGAANIPMMALIAAWFARARRGLATGTILAGNGFGIVIAGVLVPLVAAGPEGSWRAGWLFLGGICALIMAVAWLVLRDSPERIGLSPIGAAQSPPPPHVQAAPYRMTGVERRFMIHLGVVYAIFGATYMVYGSFLVTTLVEAFGLSEAAAGGYWSWVGLFSMASGPLFGRISDRLGRKTGLAAALGVQTAAYALAGLNAMGDGNGGSLLAMQVSVGLYGLAAFAIPTVTVATCADQLGANRAASGLAFVTFFFAGGQVVGPAAAGWLADATGDFAASYLLAAALTALGVLLALRLRLVRDRR
jgi:MFS family permease